MGIKYAVDETFFDRWSPQMAYILGYLYADGSLEDAHYLRGKYVRVSSTDREIIEAIKNSLGAAHKVIKVKPNGEGRKTKYLLRIGSHKLYRALTSHGLHPRKSKTIRLPQIPQIYIGDFGRGYFDGDGSIYFERALGKQGKLIIKRLRITFTSGSQIFLKELASLLQKTVGTDLVRIFKNQRAFQMQYSTQDSMKLFKTFFYHTNYIDQLFLRRKYEVFLTYLTRQPTRQDGEIKRIIKDMARW